MDLRSKLWALLLLAAISVQARSDTAKLPSLTTGSTLELKRAGVRLKPFRGLKSVPIPTVDSFAGRDGKEYFPTRGLWVREQHIAQITSAHAYISLLDMKYPLSTDLARIPAITAAGFAAAVKDKPMTWEPEMLKTWVMMYGGKVKSTNTKVSSLRMKYPYVQFIFEQGAPELVQAYAVKVSDTRIVFAHFKFVPGYKESQIDSAIAKVLKSMSFFKGKASAGPSSKFQQHRGVTSKGRSAKYEAARNKVIQNIGNLKDWWYVETDNYILKSNMTSRNRGLVKKVQGDIEIMRRSYEVFIPPAREIEDISVVTTFNTRQEYLTYVPQNYAWTGGLWMPSRKELVISPYNWKGKYRKMGLQETLNTAYHEAFHQFLFYAMPNIRVPAWFNEGHAVLFESVKINRLKKLIEVKEHANYAAVIEKMIEEKRIGIENLIRMDYGQFYSGDATLQYAQAWALIYFLRKAAPFHKKSGKKYHLVCDQLLTELKSGKDWKKANEAAFSEIQLSRLQQDFISFWSSTSERAAARRVRLITEKEMWKRSQKDAADRLALRKELDDKRLGYSKSKADATKKKKPAKPKPEPEKPVAVEVAAVFTYNTQRNKTPDGLKPPLIKAVKWIQAKHGKEGKIVSRAYAKNVDGHRIFFLQVTTIFTNKPKDYREAFTRELFEQWQTSCRESKQVGGKNHVHLVFVDDKLRVLGGMRLKDGNPDSIPAQ